MSQNVGVGATVGAVVAVEAVAAAGADDVVDVASVSVILPRRTEQ